jgi:hypothetical protein
MVESSESENFKFDTLATLNAVTDSKYSDESEELISILCIIGFDFF